tara:strand:- start:2313 stop:2513 length:201 start_codon:yes stop_codon:yes gene_type:complete
MRIKKSQLRRIIQEEKDRLAESKKNEIIEKVRQELFSLVDDVGEETDIGKKLDRLAAMLSQAQTAK